MVYAVRLFLNTGFNPVNIPDTPALLLSAASATIEPPSINILQNRFLSSVRIKATWSQVENCDYCSIGDFYYSVTSAKMLSADTAELSLSPDFFTSAGGIGATSSFDILDGITDRATIAKANDTWGAYTDADPLTAPQRPLNIITKWTLSDVTTQQGRTYLSSTLDLDLQGKQNEGITYTDSETGETVTVPRTYQISQSQETITRLPDGDAMIGTTDGTRYYDTSSGTDENNAKKGIAKARALGIDGAIINQWRVPGRFAQATFGEEGSVAVTQLDGTTGTTSDTIASGYATVKNMRVLYGDYNKYGIMTTAGNSLECKPEEILSASGSPSIRWLSDPRPDGKPYFRFNEINSNTEFWRNSIAGSPWQNVPLVYQGNSGTALTRMNFDNTRRTEQLAKKQYDDTTIFNQAANFVSTATDIVSTATSAALSGSGAFGGLAAGVASAASGIKKGLRMEMEFEQYNERYRATKANELSQLYQDTTIYTPTVNFPFNADIMRDIKGNAILVYKYQYDALDITRIDKLLTMYGYKEAEPLTLANFTRRPKFDYIQCSTVTIGGLAKWWNTGIADQLKNGVRIWHVKPDASIYDNGNEDSTT